MTGPFFVVAIRDVDRRGDAWYFLVPDDPDPGWPLSGRPPRRVPPIVPTGGWTATSTPDVVFELVETADPTDRWSDETPRRGMVVHPDPICPHCKRGRSSPRPPGDRPRPRPRRHRASTAGADRPTSAEDTLDLLTLLRPAWHAETLRAGDRPQMFPCRRARPPARHHRRLPLCDRCPACNPCADQGRTSPERYGVWGGTGPAVTDAGSGNAPPRSEVLADGDSGTRPATSHQHSAGHLSTSAIAALVGPVSPPVSSNSQKRHPSTYYRLKETTWTSWKHSLPPSRSGDCYGRPMVTPRNGGKPTPSPGRRRSPTPLTTATTRAVDAATGAQGSIARPDLTPSPPPPTPTTTSRAEQAVRPAARRRSVGRRANMGTAVHAAIEAVNRGRTPWWMFAESTSRYTHTRSTASAPRSTATTSSSSW